MKIIFFLFVVILIIIVSVKLSYYADALDKTTQFGSMIAGGMLLAGITSLPELITSIFNIVLEHPKILINNILSSNILNIIIMALFDIFYIKKRFMDKISPFYLGSHLVLIYIYIMVIAYFKGDLVGKIYNVGIPSIIIFLSFLIYIMVISRNDTEEEKIRYKMKDTKIGIKLFIIGISMIVASIFLICFVNGIMFAYQTTIIWSFLLKIILCLPELVSFYILLRIENYNLAYGNIIGSCIINFVILSICDLLLVNKTIYDFYDNHSLVLVYLGLWFSIILMYPVKREKSIFMPSYILPSLFIIIIFTLFGYLLFLNI